MKKVILVLLCALYATGVYSQNCEFQKNGVDEFTGDTIVSTKFIQLYNAFMTSNCFLEMKFTSINRREISIGVRISVPIAHPYPSISAGKKLYLKLLNGDIITLTTLIDSDVFTKISSMQVYPISTEDLIKIRDIGIEKFRIETDSNQYENITKPQKKVNKKIAKNIDCFLKEINYTN